MKRWTTEQTMHDAERVRDRMMVSIAGEAIPERDKEIIKLLNVGILAAMCAVNPESIPVLIRQVRALLTDGKRAYQGQFGKD